MRVNAKVMANLVIEIGNTAIKVAWTQGVTLGKTMRYQGEKAREFLQSVLEKEKPFVMAVSSQKPLNEDEEVFLKNNCSHLLILDQEHKNILRRHELPDYLSYDRAVALIAARFLFKGKSCSVFDFGTTLTVDFLDYDGQYKGGNISLGCRTRFKSLNRYAKNLPLIDTPSEIVKIGSSLQSSIEAGVISGIMFEIDGYIRRYPQNIVVFTGGDAIYFAQRLKNSIFAVSNMGLIGLAIITDEYVKRNLI